MRKTVSWWIRPCQPFTILEGKDGFRHFSGDLGQGLFKSDKWPCIDLVDKRWVIV
jgi:hypothetical protein